MNIEITVNVFLGEQSAGETQGRCGQVRKEGLAGRDLATVVERQKQARRERRGKMSEAMLGAIVRDLGLR